jgi:hypothetical protein
MIFAAFVPHLWLHRIQAAEIFEQTVLDLIKALGNLPRSCLGALLVGLQSAPEDESAADKREADDDQRDT